MEQKLVRERRVFAALRPNDRYGPIVLKKSVLKAGLVWLGLLLAR
jgi:hypothetical protein